MKTLAGWEASRLDLGKYLSVGDPVDIELYMYVRDVMCPAHWSPQLVQMGEAQGFVDNQNTYLTLKNGGDTWVYAGECHLRSDKHVGR